MTTENWKIENLKSEAGKAFVQMLKVAEEAKKLGVTIDHESDWLGVFSDLNNIQNGWFEVETK